MIRFHVRAAQCVMCTVHKVCLDLLLPLLKHAEEWRWKNRKRGELSHICDCEHAAAEKMTEDGYRTTLRYQKTQELKC